MVYSQNPYLQTQRIRHFYYEFLYRNDIYLMNLNIGDCGSTSTIRFFLAGIFAGSGMITDKVVMG